MLVKFSLSAGNASGAKECPLLLASIGKREGAMLLMDKAYEDNRMRAFAEKLGFAPAMPPKRSYKKPWDYDRELYKECNGIDRFFRRLKALHRMSPVTTSATLYSAHSFIWLVSIWLYAVSNVDLKVEALYCPHERLFPLPFTHR